MSLESVLARHLPQNELFKFIYIQSKPIYIKSPINIPKSCSNRPNTIKIRHFFCLINQDVIILGIEVFVYLQIYPTHVDQYIFVSKCDTTGLKKLTYRVGDIVELVLRYIVDYDVGRYNIKERLSDEQQKEKEETNGQRKKEGATYVNETLALIDKLQTKLSTDPNHFDTLTYYGNNAHLQHNSKPNRLRKLPPHINSNICLFTKTAPQYMFPNSSKNKYKHLSNGQVLLSWWLKIIESICGTKWPVKRLIIPGSDEIAMKKFITNLPNWSIGHIFGNNHTKETKGASEYVTGKLDLAVYNIPLFPDDPKGRFLEHLIVENRYFNVNIDRFYQELGYRQEFRLGDCVGLIGCSKTDNHTQNGSNDYNKEEEKENVIVITVHQYKQFINNVIKLINFDKLIDVEYLTQVQIPAFFKETLRMDEFKYGEFIGEKQQKMSIPVGSNGGEKRVFQLTEGADANGKKANDLTGLIKRKKR